MDIKDTIMRDAIKVAINAERERVIYRLAFTVSAIANVTLLAVMVWGYTHG